jgi:anaerobic magnesium-protoporphyrin IX monomethyl ester cyclase
MAKKKLLLLNAPPIAILEPWFDAPEFVRTALAVLAGYFRENSDWEIKCLDAKYEKLTFEETVAKVKNYNPDVVGLTAFTNEIKPSAYLAGLIKRNLPTCTTVIGGAHFTAIPEETMAEFPTFDIGVIGEGEETLVEICNTIERGLDLKDIKGIVYRKGGTIIKNELRPRILEQDAMPMAAWDLLPPAKEYYIQTVRGCPFACLFCLNHNGKVARKRGVPKTIEEMEWLINDFGAKRISFGDELFSVDMKRTEALLDAMIQHKIGERVRWDIQTHVAFVDDNLLRKMKLANIDKIEMGVESGDELTLKRMGKGTTKEMILKAFATAHKYKLRTGSFFIIGQPNETHETIRNSLKLAIKINPSEPIFGTMVPYPGTEIARMAANGEGGYKLLTTNWDEYRKQLNGSMEINSIPRAALERYQLFGYVIVFLANFRFFDLLKFFWDYRIGAINLFQKALFGGKSTENFMTFPKDYNEVINSTTHLTMQQIIKSRETWKKLQSNEVKRAKELAPYLLDEQMPI